MRFMLGATAVLSSVTIAFGPHENLGNFRMHHPASAR